METLKLELTIESPSPDCRTLIYNLDKYLPSCCVVIDKAMGTFDRTLAPNKNLESELEDKLQGHKRELAHKIAIMEIRKLGLDDDEFRTVKSVINFIENIY